MSLRIRSLPFLALSTAAALTLSACSGGESGQPSTPAAGSSASTAAEKSADPKEQKKAQHAALAKTYGEVLDDPTKYPYKPVEGFEPDGDYSYALVEATGDDFPELLLKHNRKGSWEIVTVFSQAPGQELTASRESLAYGAASAGGGRYDVLASATGDRLYYASWQSVSPTASMQGYVIKDGDLVKDGPENTAMALSKYDNEHLQVTWLPSTDRSLLDKLRDGKWEKPAPDKSASAGTAKTHAQCGDIDDLSVFTGTEVTSCEFASAVAKAVQSAPGAAAFHVQAVSPVTGKSYDMSCTSNQDETVCSGGNNAQVVLRRAGVAGAAGGENAAPAAAAAGIYEGTVAVFTGAELMEGQSTPNGEDPSSEYIVLVFDAPQVVFARTHSANQFGLDGRTKKMLSLGMHETTEYRVTDTTGPWRKYVGKRVRVRVDTQSFYHKSDTGMPLGVPQVPEATAVEVLN